MHSVTSSWYCLMFNNYYYLTFRILYVCMALYGSIWISLVSLYESLCESVYGMPVWTWICWMWICFSIFCSHLSVFALIECRATDSRAPRTELTCVRVWHIV